MIGASKVARDISGRKRAEKLQRLLVEELNHRVKNTLATIQAIASQSLRRAKSPGDFVASFTGRIQALAKAHTLLTETRLEGAYLIDLVREQVLLGVPDNRISPSGPQLMAPFKQKRREGNSQEHPDPEKVGATRQDQRPSRHSAPSPRAAAKPTRRPKH